jgi:hypothetical protein
MDDAAEKNEPDREETLAAIDFEIDWAANERKRPGWTEWAIYGGLAIVFWSIFSFSYSESLSLIGTAQILLTLFFVYDSLGLFRQIYEAGKTDDSTWLYFHREAYRISPRTQFAELSIRIALIVVAFSGAAGVWWPNVVIVWVWLLLAIAIPLYRFWIWFEDFPISQSSNRNPRRGFSLIVSAFFLRLQQRWLFCSQHSVI